MPETALVERLRQDAQTAIDALWRVARVGAAEARAESDRQIADARAHAAQALAGGAAEAHRTIIAEADREARRIRTAATAATADRLRALARDALHQFRDGAYGELFDALAAELPPLQYEEIVVNPQDLQRARARFPRARASADAGIAGGLDASSDGGRVRISNTLATRLDAIWPTLVSRVMRDVLEANDAL